MEGNCLLEQITRVCSSSFGACCPGCKSSNHDTVVLQCVLGLDAAIPHLALLKELLAHYVLLPYILIKMFFKGFLLFLCGLKNCLEVGRLYANISVNG